VRNVGNRPHSFPVLGKQTGLLRLRRTKSFSVALVRRCVFPYQSALDKGKPAFRGLFLVR